MYTSDLVPLLLGLFSLVVQYSAYYATLSLSCHSVRDNSSDLRPISPKRMFYSVCHSAAYVERRMDSPMIACLPKYLLSTFLVGRYLANDKISTLTISCKLRECLLILKNVSRIVKPVEQRLGLVGQ